MNSQNIPNEAPLIYNQGGGQISPSSFAYGSSYNVLSCFVHPVPALSIVKIYAKLLNEKRKKFSWNN